MLESSLILEGVSDGIQAIKVRNREKTKRYTLYFSFPVGFKGKYCTKNPPRTLNITNVQSPKAKGNN